MKKSSDGGKTGLEVLKDKGMQSLSGGIPYDHTMAVAVHPGNSALVFVGTTNHGLFFSTDAGNTWRWCKDFYFTNAQSIAFDPRDGDRIIVTTFGAGVWSASISRIVSGN